MKFPLSSMSRRLSPLVFFAVLIVPFFGQKVHAQTVDNGTAVISVFVNNPSPSLSPSPSGSSGGSGGSGGSAVYGQVHNIAFLGFTSTVGATSTEVDWQTSVPTVSQIEWGTDYDASIGTVSEVAYSTTHSVIFNNLDPNTSYYVSITATSYSGLTSEMVNNFVTNPLPVSAVAFSPQNVHDFTVTPLNNQAVSLAWVNPVEQDMTQVHIRRGTRYFPTDPTEGYIVYDGKGQSVIDNTVLPGTHYYYSAFTENAAGAYSSGALAEYSGTTSANPSSSTAPLYGGTVSIATTTFSNIAFVQNNVRVSPNSVNPNEPLVLTIHPLYIPSVAQQTILTLVQDGVTQRFLFSYNPDGSLSAVVPALYFHSTSTPLTVDFLSKGGDVKINGVVSIVKSVNSSPTITPSNTKTFITEMVLVISIISILSFLVIIARSTIE